MELLKLILNLLLDEKILFGLSLLILGLATVSLFRKRSHYFKLTQKKEGDVASIHITFQSHPEVPTGVNMSQQEMQVHNTSSDKPTKISWFDPQYQQDFCLFIALNQREGELLSRIEPKQEKYNDKY